MRKYVLFLIFFGFISLANSSHLCAEETTSEVESLEVENARLDAAADQLGRGVENIFFSLLEIPYRIGKTNEEKGVLSATTIGVAKGLGYALGRIGVGIYEVVTFPFPSDPLLPPLEELF